METVVADSWESKVVSPETVIGKIKPGMSIFLGTAGAEPRTMVRHLMTTDSKNLEDLELIQLVSFGDAISLQTLQSQKFRLTTFFSGWVADEAIEEGRVDMIPSRFVKIPQLIESRLSPVDVAIVQITPPMKPDIAASASLWMWPGKRWSRPPLVWLKSIPRFPVPTGIRLCM